jgi:hypothetical protein
MLLNIRDLKLALLSAYLSAGHTRHACASLGLFVSLFIDLDGVENYKNLQDADNKKW